MSLEEKKKVVAELVESFQKNKLVGIVNMYKMPASQLQSIRMELHGRATIKVVKRSLLLRAIRKSGLPGICDLEKNVIGEVGIVLSDLDPFELFDVLEKNKVPAFAKAGDVAQDDILISEGPTGIPAGPAIGQLQKFGIRTEVSEGKINVVEGKVVAKKGDKISPELASLLQLLKIKSMKIGLNLAAVWHEGLVFDQTQLRIDANEWFGKYLDAFRHALSVSMESGYLVPETAEMIIVKAYNQALNLGLEGNIYEQEVVGELLAVAARGANALKSAAG